MESREWAKLKEELVTLKKRMDKGDEEKKREKEKETEREKEREKERNLQRERETKLESEREEERKKEKEKRKEEESKTAAIDKMQQQVVASLSVLFRQDIKAETSQRVASVSEVGFVCVRVCVYTERTELKGWECAGEVSILFFFTGTK